jgi:hypothetical protein
VPGGPVLKSLKAVITFDKGCAVLCPDGVL